MRGAGLEELLPRVAEIVADVRARGDAALLDWTERLDGERPGSLRVPDDALGAAELEPDVLASVRALAAAVAAVARTQRPADSTVEAVPGIVSERRAKAQMRAGTPGSRHAAHDSFREAMEWYEKAEALRPAGNDDALLRWNACARILMAHPHLQPAREEPYEAPLE